MVTRSSSAKRKYLPTLADLVDRLSIVQLKAINIQDRRDEYRQEIKDIEHDIDIILKEHEWWIAASEIRAIMIIMLTNHFIWVNEAKAREGGDEQDKLLKLTHSINGVRNAAKNKLAEAMGERKDWKVDCFAAGLVEEFGNWSVFED